MTIKEENLIPYKGNIKAGQRLMKVGNSWMPVGIGGKYPPGSVQGGGVYYKCASVNTTAKTWSGYKAVLTDGVYTFEEVVTEGLTFGAGFTPGVGKIYNADATVRVDKLFEGASAVPDNGLIFYLPFNGNAEPVEGEVTSMTGELTYGEANGVGYGVFNGSQYFTCTSTEEKATECTIAITYRLPESTSSGNFGAIQLPNIANSSNPLQVGIWPYASSPCVVFPDANTVVIARGSFYSIMITCDSTGKWCGYLNGSNVTSNTKNEYISEYNTQSVKVGHGYYTDTAAIIGDICDVAVWNRVLTEEEIAQVAARAASMNG